MVLAALTGDGAVGYAYANRGRSVGGHSMDTARPQARTVGTDEAWSKLDGLELLTAVISRIFSKRIAVVSSFGAESVVLLDMVSKVDPKVPVLFLDTGKHFPETLSYRKLLQARLGLEDVRDVEPDQSALEREDPHGDLWVRNPDRCCHVRKVASLERALDGFDAWVTGRKRYHGDMRSTLPAVEPAGQWVKINPLAHWSQGDVTRWLFDNALPMHPLLFHGYTSIGCAPCTRRTHCWEDLRAGRWAGFGKTECGIHTTSGTTDQGRE